MRLVNLLLVLSVIFAALGCAREEPDVPTTPAPAGRSTEPTGTTQDGQPLMGR